jgi:AcrR family transcriptional regulator
MTTAPLPDTQPPAAPGRRLGPDARRAQLVEVGLALVKTMRFDEVTAEVVARASGVSKGLVFHYFPATSDLQVAILRAASAELLSEIDVGGDLPPDERLRVGLDAFVRYIEQQPASYQAVARRAWSDQRLLAVFEDTRAAVVGIIAGALGFSELPAGLRLVFRGWIAMVEECILDWLDDKPVPRAELLEFLAGAALTMLPEALKLGATGACGSCAPLNHADTQGRDEERLRFHTAQLWDSSGKSWNVTGMPRRSKIRCRSTDSTRDWLSLAPTSRYTPSGLVSGMVGRYWPGVLARSAWRSDPNRSPV